jgi:hypothetical protein
MVTWRARPVCTGSVNRTPQAAGMGGWRWQQRRMDGGREDTAAPSGHAHDMDMKPLKERHVKGEHCPRGSYRLALKLVTRLTVRVRGAVTRPVLLLARRTQ